MTRPLPTVKTIATEAYNDRRSGPARDEAASSAEARAIVAAELRLGRWTERFRQARALKFDPGLPAAINGLHGLLECQAEAEIEAASAALQALQLEHRYNVDQPRVPAGTSTGGQWIGNNNRVTGSAQPKPIGIPKVTGEPLTGSQDAMPVAAAAQTQQPQVAQPFVPANSVSGVPSADRSATPPATFEGKIIQDPTTAGQPQLPADAVRLMTPDGQQVFNPYSGKDGQTPQYIYFPPARSPDFFVKAGQDYINAEHLPDSNPLSDSGTEKSPFFAGLMGFVNGWSWDAQRIGGTFHNAYVDYATVAIGLYSAAAGLQITTVLQIENVYAKYFSNFGSVPMDDVYTYLPRRNVTNTLIGYAFYNFYK